jgi:flagellar L-ring protein precursor FlgH
LVVIAFMVGGLQACASPPISSRLIVPPLPPPKTVGSLWQEENGRAFLYEDLRAMRVGDILTIKIMEKQQGSKSAETEANRNSSMDDSLTGNTIGIPSVVLNKFQANSAGITSSAEHKFQGKGATSRADTLTGTMSAHVTEVMPNGDLRIEGRREVTVNSEKQTMLLSGVVRRVDVDTRNTVMSTAIADARIEYTGLGVVDEVQRPGWFQRLMNYFYPF